VSGITALRKELCAAAAEVPASLQAVVWDVYGGSMCLQKLESMLQLYA
jgi:hypothetical protein